MGFGIHEGMCISYVNIIKDPLQLRVESSSANKMFHLLILIVR
jgi:hypothetical protein